MHLENLVNASLPSVLRFSAPTVFGVARVHFSGGKSKVHEATCTNLHLLALSCTNLRKKYFCRIHKLRGIAL
jgi:hypothetical protein